MFDSVLVANRGEIAVRVIRTLREHGIRSIAVYSDADWDAPHVALADEAVRIGPPAATDSYLNVDAVIGAALASGAAAIHPGYGFLSENPAFARACRAAGIVFIGPPVEAIESMGDKIAAKTRVAAAGVPVVPGSHDDDMSDHDLSAAISEIGLPALLKPSAGGGGKGMRVVRASVDVSGAISAARREAVKAFGDDRLLVERYIERPRHIEVQVLADQYGTVIHLGERECSLQRRHQKVIEEAPSPMVSAPLRERLGAAAIHAARSCGYQGAGTVEFIVDGKDPDSFYFLEMNTRLQVEHPVTELVTGWDLVEWQLRVAAGESLPTEPDGVPLRGHAIEARVYAEDPGRDFLPSTGRLRLVRESRLARLDSGVQEGQTVTPYYDPMIAKVIAHGTDRAHALERLQAALRGTVHLGVVTNTGYLGRLLGLPEVIGGQLHTGLIAEHPEIALNPPASDHVVAAAALEWLLRRVPAEPGDSWLLPDGWRPVGRAASALRLRGADGAVDVAVTGLPADCQVQIGAAAPLPCSASWRGDELSVTVAGDTRIYLVAHSGNEVWLASGGEVQRFSETDRLDAESAASDTSDLGPVRSPMPGAVIAVHVQAGQVVAAGAPLVTVEAMKMEHTLAAPAAALVAEVLVSEGGQVAMEQVLVMLATAQGDPVGERTLPDVHLLSGLPERVTIWEVGPRDGLQNEAGLVPPSVKVEFIQRLALAGLPVVEATSFVRPDWVPQLADAVEVFAGIERRPGVRYPVLVPNVRGLVRALECGATDVAVFASATESFARRNLNRSLESQMEMFAPVIEGARAAGARVRGYVSMCFGDPWEGRVDPAQVVSVCRELVDRGCDQLSLGDTIGVATPGQVATVIQALSDGGIDRDAVGVHFHDTYGQALANTLAALQHGISIVDSSAGGLGGCPYARSATGNLATEDLVWMLDGLGVQTGVDLDALVETSAWLADQLGRPSPSRVVTALTAGG